MRRNAMVEEAMVEEAMVKEAMVNDVMAEDVMVEDVVVETEMVEAAMVEAAMMRDPMEGVAPASDAIVRNAMTTRALWTKAMERVLRALRPLPAAVLAAGLAFFAAAPAAAQAARYEIDPEHLSIGFLVHHISYANVLGMFRSAKGSYSYDEKTGTLGDVRIEVETGSVFTNHRKRDEHLKGPDFLNSSEFPTMTFSAGSAKRTGDKTFQIDGNLQLLGRSLPMTLQATINKQGEYELGTFRKPYVMGISARGSFKRSAYGMKYGVDNGWVGDEVAMIIEFEAQRR